MSAAAELDLQRLLVWTRETTKRFETLARLNRIPACAASDSYYAQVGKQLVAEIEKVAQAQS